MLKLIGGELYQWDKCRKIAIDDPEGKITEIHYARDCDNSCIVVTVKTDESGAKYAEIPNILLQSFCPVFAYAVNVQNGESITVTASTFIVRQKGKPADYVYTETEVLCYKELDKRIKKLEEGGGSGKSAYEYAKDGGYTGTEEEFAEKLASEQKNEVVYVNITENEDGTYSADKTTAELTEAYNSGCAIFARLNYAGEFAESLVYGLVYFAENEDYTDFAFAAFDVVESASCIVISRTDETTDTIEIIPIPIGGGEGNAIEPLTINGTEYDGSEAVSVDTRDFVINVISEDEESGECTLDVTVEDLFNACNTGRTMVVDFLGMRLSLLQKEIDADVGWGYFVFSAYVNGNSVAVEVQIDDYSINATLSFFDFTDTINNMIDEKLGVIENGSY